MKKRLSPLARVRRFAGDLRARALSRRHRRAAIAALPRVGGMASIPSRAGDLALVLERILPQVERLHLFLHGYEAIPPEARDPRIIPVLAPRSHPYRTSGKFHGLLGEPADCLYVCFDDDVLYPPDYVDRLAGALIRHEGDAIVGFHGFRYLPPYRSYIRDRKGFFFGSRQRFEHSVDELGTGTVAFLTSRLRFDPTSWKYGDMDDLNVALEAERARLKRVTLPRRKRYLLPVDGHQAESLWRDVLTDESRSVEMMRVLARAMGRLPAEP